MPAGNGSSAWKSRKGATINAAAGESTSLPRVPQPVRSQLSQSRWANTSQSSIKQPTTKSNGGCSINHKQYGTDQRTAPAIQSGIPNESRGQSTQGLNPITELPGVDHPRPHKSNNETPQKVPPHLWHTLPNMPQRLSAIRRHATPTAPELPNSWITQTEVEGKPAPDDPIQPTLTEALPSPQTTHINETSTRKEISVGVTQGRRTPTLSMGHSEYDKSLVYTEDETLKNIIKDIRGELFCDEMWDNQEWDVPRNPSRRRREWDSESLPNSDHARDDRTPFVAPDTLLHRWVTTWMDSVPDVRATFLDAFAGRQCSEQQYDVKEQQDIDTMTGKLIPAVAQPTSRRGYNNPRNYKLTQKLETQTSQSSSNRVIAKKAKAEEKNKEEERSRLALVQQQEKENEAERTNPYLCRIAAHLRPAEDADMDQVAEIYKKEVREGWGALDERPLPVATWRSIRKTCWDETLPFIVAMSGYRNPHIPVGQGNHKVIGFIFLDIGNRGIAGSMASPGKCSAKIYILVDPEYRRQRLGTSLLDAVFLRTSRPYMYKEDSYQFVNPDGYDLYRERFSRIRRFNSIFMEVYIKNLGGRGKTTEGEEYKFFDKFLGDFDMSRVAHMGNFAVIRETFLDRLIFEHKAVTFYGIEYGDVVPLAN